MPLKVWPTNGTVADTWHVRSNRCPGVPCCVVYVVYALGPNTDRVNIFLNNPKMCILALAISLKTPYSLWHCPAEIFRGTFRRKHTICVGLLFEFYVNRTAFCRKKCFENYIKVAWVVCFNTNTIAKRRFSVILNVWPKSKKIIDHRHYRN